LWEFAHLQSGEPALRDDSGRLSLDEATGLVLVLVPGGRFLMGAQPPDPAPQGSDAESIADNERPVHEVELGPYFIAKHELTQAQWRRIWGANPSYYSNSQDLKVSITDLHPVENVTWLECVEAMRRLGLTLPSEAQWEHAARGGRAWPWWTGPEKEGLQGRANLADRTAFERLGVDWPALKDWPEFLDGHALHAPVGSYPANPYGLHDTIGNVNEFCLDGYDERYYVISPRRDPVCHSAQAIDRVARGGSYGQTASMARASARLSISPETKDPAVGLRPARGLDP
jgi:formylglycine-generating enzyme required for sulfatase activity